MAGQFATAFWTGAAVLLLELLGTRLAAPLYGATVYVWSALITVTLAALAAGYAGGGALADRPHGGDAERALSLRIAAVLGVAGVWTLLVPAARLPVMAFTSRFGVRVGVLAGASALLAVPLACLGTIGPLLARLRAAEPSSMGRAMGSVSAVSTVGSVFGALAAGFWLIPSVGMGRLFLGIALSLVLLSLLWLRKGKAGRGAVGALLAAAVAGALVRPAVKPIVGLRSREASLYGDILVVDNAGWGKRILYIDGIANTVVDLSTLQSTSDYITSFELARFLRPAARKALLIGLGGGALPGRLARFGISTDVVDIDPAVERAARGWFGFKPTGEFHLEDGRRFISKPGPAYDLVYFDAFNGDSQPFHMFTRESFEATARRLSPDGVLVINLIGYAMGPRAGLKRSVVKTLKEVFPNVRLLAANTDLNPATTYVNMTLLASRGPLEFQADPSKDLPLSGYAEKVRGNWVEEGEGLGEVLTDDRSPVEALGSDAFVAIRQRDLESNLELLSL